MPLIKNVDCYHNQVFTDQSSIGDKLIEVASLSSENKGYFKLKEDGRQNFGCQPQRF